MYTYRDIITENIIKELDGLSKIEACDLLQLVEELMSKQPSPIQSELLLQSFKKQLIKKNIVVATTSVYCQLYDNCRYLTVYRYTDILPNIFTHGDLYFTVGNGYQSYQLTKKNIVQQLSIKPIKHIINQFLRDNKVTDKNPKTKRLLLLELLDQIDQK